MKAGSMLWVEAALILLSYVPKTNSDNAVDSAGSCQYKFEIFQPGKDILEQLRNLETKCDDVKTQAANGVQQMTNSYQGSLLQWQNTTHDLEKDILQLKVEDAQMRAEQKDVRMTLQAIQTESEMLKRETAAVKARTDTLRRYKSDIKTGNRGIKKEIALLTKTSGKLQNGIGDLKAEWLLIKRHVENIKSDNVNLKYGQNNLKTDVSNLEKLISGHQSDTQDLKKEQNDIKSDSVQLTKRLDDIKNENMKMKDAQSDVQMASIRVRQQIRDIHDETDALEKQIETLKQQNTQLHRGLMVLKNAVEEGGDGNDFVWPEMPPLRMWPNPFDEPDDGRVSNSKPKSNTIRIPRDCHDHVVNGHTTSGVYKIKPKNISHADNVYCEITHKTGWTLLQRRIDGSLDFNRGWLEYKFGFGNPYGEFWLGNEWIHYITSSKDYVLRIDMWDWEGRYYYAQYEQFRIGSSADKYLLLVKGYRGNAGDSFSINDNTAFSTSDSDNDLDRKNCAAEYNSGWWFRSCGISNLNGKYSKGRTNEGILWYTIKETEFYSLKKVEIKIRPKYAIRLKD